MFGQDPAIDALAASIKMARAGLGKMDKPIGAFLFSGPTGVGKTEVARQLAFTLGIELIRFDMSEYMERHAVSRLIGAPPGYVGFDWGGLLTEAVSKKPHCVLLLDEIEKAHPDIFNVLLQVMDHGTLTDNNGRKADFRNVIIIMTTNAGAESMQKATIGFTTRRETGDEMTDIKRLFTPEFRNRLDSIISFRSLDEEIIMRVVDKFLIQLEEQLHEEGRRALHRRVAQASREARLRSADGRATDAAADPGHDSPCAGRRIAVRQAVERRSRDGRRRRRRQGAVVVRQAREPAAQAERRGGRSRVSDNRVVHANGAGGFPRRFVLSGAGGDGGAGEWQRSDTTTTDVRRHRRARTGFAPRADVWADGDDRDRRRDRHGLFLGSGFAIEAAGPSVLVSYAIGALIALLLMGALAEMTVAHPTAGSFGAYAEHYVGPLAGFLVRYAYWFAVVFAIGTEISAIAVFMKYWFPAVPAGTG